MSAISVSSQHIDDTIALATRLSACVKAGDCITLSGEVGAGKTSFVQAFLKPLLLQDEAVTSPTYTLVQWYDTKRSWQVCHADLYRLEHPSDFMELGLEEAFDHHITIVEWPEIVLSYLPKERLDMMIEHRGGDHREILLRTDSPDWQQRIEALAL